MCVDTPRILLVGKGFTPGSQFVQRLCHNGCGCGIAKNLAEARAALASHSFHLVLSEMTLPDGSASPLLGLLESTKATLFFCVAVHDGCWWLPALDRGQRTWGQAALRPPDFAHELVTLLGPDAFSHPMETPELTEAGSTNIIPMPSIELVPPGPERVVPQKVKAQKSSA